MKKILLPALAAGLALSASALDVVKGGKAAAVVVIPDNAVPSVEFAARELVYHVRQSADVELPIVKESAAASNKAHKIYLGATKAAGKLDTAKLNRNGFYIKSLNDSEMVIVGRDVKSHWKNDSAEAGTRMGVSHLLDTQLGVRWIFPGKLGEIIPKKSEIVLPKLDITFIQPLESSRHSKAFIAFTGWKNKAHYADFHESEVVFQHRHGFSWEIPTRNQHSMGKYHERFFKTTPQMFNMLPDGTRRSDTLYFRGRPDLVSMCVSSPELADVIINDWKARRSAKEPNVFVGENDSAGKCVCDKCLAWDGIGNDQARRAAAEKAYKAGKRDWYKALGNVSGRYAKLYQIVYERAVKIDPNVKVIGLAYTNYQDGPPDTPDYKLNKNVIICFTNDLMYPWTAEKIERTKKAWNVWSKTGASMAFRPNFMLDGHNMPINLARKYHALHWFLRDNGMISTYFDSNTGQYGANGLGMYIVARMTMRPDLSFEAIQNEYCGAFGAAADEIKKYFEYWEKVSDSAATVKAHESAVLETFGADLGGYAQFFMIAPRIYTPEVFKQGFAILDRASKLVAPGSVESKRVDYLRKALKHAELTVQAELAYESGDKKKLAAAVKVLDDYRASIEADKVSNMPWLFNREDAKWDRTSLYFMLNAPGKLLENGWKMCFDIEEKGVEKNYHAADFDDSKWQDAQSGVAWENHPAGLAWRKAHKGVDYDGIGWYRYNLDIPEAAGKAKYILTFGAVDEACQVFVNGKMLLDRPYPYKGDKYSWDRPFTLDITTAVKPGKNVLAVRVIDRSGAGGLVKPVWFSTERSDSVVLNSGFEQGKAQWTMRGAGNACNIDNKVFKSGKQSLRITVTPGMHGCYQKISLKKGRIYRLKTSVKTSADFKGLLLVSLEVPVKKHKTIQSTSGIWSGVEISDITVKEDAEVDLHICSIRDSRGTVWIDDVMLIDETATAAPPAPPDNASLVRNCSFEKGKAQWNMRGAGNAHSFDKKIFKSGKQSLRVVITPGMHGCYQNNIPLQKGKVYKLRASVRTSENFEGLLLASLEKPASRHATISSTKGEWKEMIIDNIQVNADCQIQLHLCSVRQSKGIVWFDDVILAEK